MRDETGFLVQPSGWRVALFQPIESCPSHAGPHWHVRAVSEPRLALEVCSVTPPAEVRDVVLGAVRDLGVAFGVKPDIELSKLEALAFDSAVKAFRAPTCVTGREFSVGAAIDLAQVAATWWEGRKA